MIIHLAASVPTNLLEQEVQMMKWQKQDTVWMLGLYGTAIGAGTLFLPIKAGSEGIWPLILMVILAFPMTYFSHQGLCRFVLSGSGKKNITEVVDEHFGHSAGHLLTLLYFFAIYPILLMYSVAITNTTQNFITNQMGMTSPPRAVLAIILIFGLMAVIRFGEHVIVKSMSLLVYPFIFVLMMLSLYLVPYWNSAIFHPDSNVLAAHGDYSLLKTIWLTIPVMVFSFNHSPIISSFAINQKERYGENAEQKCNAILKYSHIMMVMTVLFFVLSCVFSLSPDDMLQARQQNISILSYLANHFQTPMIAYVAPFIAFIAISKSFFGHYLGAKEGLNGIVSKYLRARGKDVNNKKLHQVMVLMMIGTCWVAASYNPSILGMMEMLSGPVIALILFLLPMYAIATVPALKKYQKPAMFNIFIAVIGVISLTAILYGLI